MNTPCRAEIDLNQYQERQAALGDIDEPMLLEQLAMLVEEHVADCESDYTVDAFTGSNPAWKEFACNAPVKNVHTDLSEAERNYLAEKANEFLKAINGGLCVDLRSIAEDKAYEQ